MNAALKIAMPPLEFAEFNALDVLVNAEIGELAYRLRAIQRRAEFPDGLALDQERPRRLLERLRALRTKIDAARPQGYAAAIRAARAESVCDT